MLKTLNVAGPTREELERWDREIVWHAFTQMSEYEPLIIERANGCTLVRRRRPRISRRHQQRVVQHPRPSPSAARRGHPPPARQSGPRHVAGGLESNHDPTGQAAGRYRAAGLGARLLFRRRRHGRRSGLEDGPAILAAAQRSAARQDDVPGAGQCLSRRHAGQRERGGRRAVSRHVPAAAVRCAASPVARYVSLAARRDARNGADALSGRGRADSPAASPADCRGGGRAAGAGGGRHDRPSARILAGPARTDPALRSAVDRRRSGGRVWTHRHDVRLRAESK